MLYIVKYFVGLLKPGPHQQQCRSNIVEAKWQLCCLLQCCFDIVAKNGNNIESTFDFVEATFDFVVAFDNVASTVLLVWTRLKTSCPMNTWGSGQRKQLSGNAIKPCKLNRSNTFVFEHQCEKCFLLKHCLSFLHMFTLISTVVTFVISA